MERSKSALALGRPLLVALLFACLASWGAADGRSFLEGEAVRGAREGFSDTLEQIATLFESDLEVRGDARARALLMAQTSATAAEVLVQFEPHIKGDPVGDAFLADGMVVVTCLGVASVAEVDAQISMLRVAAGYWRMALLEPLTQDLCSD